MLYVSFSQEDKPIVQRICQAIIEKGVRLFAGYKHLSGGDYAQELTKNIVSADAILFFYSENTEKSTWVKHEIEFSFSKKKNIIPVLLSEPVGNSWFYFYLGTFNPIYFDSVDVDGVTHDIIDSLDISYNGSVANPPVARETVDDNGPAITKKSENTYNRPLSRNIKKLGCGLILILSLIVLFPLYYLTNDFNCAAPPYSHENSTIDSTICFNIDSEFKDSLVLKLGKGIKDAGR